MMKIPEEIGRCDHRAPLVGVAAGGRGALAGSSVHLAKQVWEQLDEAGIPAVALEDGASLAEALARRGLTILQDVTYGRYGRLEMIARSAGLAFVGTGARQAEVYDKVRLKTALLAGGAHTPPHQVLDFHNQADAWPLIIGFNGAVVVKPATADLLSQGVRWFPSADPDDPGLRHHVEDLFRIDQVVLVEELVPGTEICVGFRCTELGMEMFPALTVIKDDLLFDHAVKTAKNYRFAPVELPARVLDEVERVGRLLAAEFLISGYWYLNAMVTEEGQVSVFDAGTTVGLGEKSYFPMAAELRGLSVRQLVHHQFIEPVLALLGRDREAALPYPERRATQ
jgi:D-alanine-D-alanine ligase